MSGRKHQTCACGACTNKAPILKSVSNMPRCRTVSLQAVIAGVFAAACIINRVKILGSRRRFLCVIHFSTCSRIMDEQSSGSWTYRRVFLLRHSVPHRTIGYQGSKGNWATVIGMTVSDHRIHTVRKEMRQNEELARTNTARKTLTAVKILRLSNSKLQLSQVCAHLQLRSWQQQPKRHWGPPSR